MTLPEFFAGLHDFYKSSAPGKSSIQYMKRRIDAEMLSPGQLDKLFDHLTDKCQYFPIWEAVNAAIGELGFRAGRVKAACHWVTFKDAEGRCWAMKCPNPESPPRYPDWGSDGHLVIDSPTVDYPEADADRRRDASRAPAVFESAGQLVLDIVSPPSPPSWDDV